MTAPNIVNVKNITCLTNVKQLTTAPINVVSNEANSNSVVKVNTIILSNYTPSPASANIFFNKANTTYYIAGGIVVPGSSTLVVFGKESSLYLEEGDSVNSQASANSTLHCIASYETIQ